jgi:Sulfotransferase family
VRALLFLHIPKAGGTALWGVLSNRFAADRCLDTYYGRSPSDDELNSAGFVTGHLSMSVLDRFEEVPVSVTVLRDPIERALSVYSFFRELDEGPLGWPGLERYDAMLDLAKRHPLEEFVEMAPELAEHYLGNWQARALGAKRLDRADERLEDALEGLRRCDFVGLAERQDESVDRLAGRLGWAPLTPLPLVNVTRTRVREGEISPAALETLRELTTVDRELYAEAVRLWEEDVAQGPGPEIDDAPLVGDLRFDRPIRGSGWLGRERIGDEPYVCWIGHKAEARVDLANEPRAGSLEIEIAHVIEPAILETLRISVDGRELQPSFAESGGAVVASAPLGRRRRGRDGAVSVNISVDHASRPCDVDPDSGDNRELAIAVRRVALV